MPGQPSSAPALRRSRWELKLAESCVWVRPPSLGNAGSRSARAGPLRPPQGVKADMGESSLTPPDMGEAA